ncbi:MAG: S46 family peptidase, partial [bacterium]|nr:S46 family peptidase [bacterium]
RQQKELDNRHKGILNELSARFIDVKKEFRGQEFIPDANSTLRLTYGRIMGYSPADAVYCGPFTALKGLQEKHTGEFPFNAPGELLELYRAKDFGQFAHPGLNDVPVNILYNLDTIGGNSGSPVLNARGQLVGLNFDRAFEATINSFTWDKDLSRSIGVDIRYILWFLEKFGGVHHLLEEMKVFNK